MVRERDVAHGGIDKHPFVQGDGRVFLRQPLEYGQINGEADLGEQAEKVSDEAAIAGTGGLAAHDEYECAHSPYKDAQHFLVGDRLFQIDCSHYHGDDGQCGCNDGGVYGRSHGESEDIDTLIEYQREECGEEYLQHVPVVHLLAFAEQGEEPEAGGCAYHAECGY